MEFDHIGSKCDFNDCRQHDFLPFKCEFCSNTYCLDHRTADSHTCTQAYKRDKVMPLCPICSQVIPVGKGDNPDYIVAKHIDLGCPQVPQSHKSSNPNRCRKEGCQTREFVAIYCKKCGLNFCLKHRMEPDHSCPSLSSSSTPSPSASSKLGPATQAALAAHRSRMQKQQQQKAAAASSSSSSAPPVSPSPASSSPSSSAAYPFPPSSACSNPAAAAAAAALKRHSPHVAPSRSSPPLSSASSSASSPVIPAKAPQIPQIEGYNTKVANTKYKPLGDSNVEAAQRFLLQIYYPRGTQKASEFWFFHKRWPIGRVIDKLSEQARILNENNVPGKPRLNLFSLRNAGLKLDSSAALGEQDADLLRHGDAVLLERAEFLSDDVLNEITNPASSAAAAGCVVC